MPWPFRKSTCCVESTELSGGRQGSRRALNIQESNKQPVGLRSSGRALVVLEVTKRPRRRRLVLRPPSDQAGAEWSGRSHESRKGRSRAKQALSTMGCRVDDGINQPGEREVPLRTKVSEEGAGRVLWGCSADIVGAQIRIEGARAPTKRYKVTSIEGAFPLGGQRAGILGHWVGNGCYCVGNCPPS